MSVVVPDEGDHNSPDIKAAQKSKMVTTEESEYPKRG